MKQIINQHIENLPAEILALPRFLKTRADNPKRPIIAEWQLPANQKCYRELDGTVGFVAATEQAGGLVMFDFDHCLNEEGEFVNDAAERWFNFLHAEEYFAEVSASGSGLHLFALPTVGKFGKLNERLYFNKDKTAFLEIFYGATRFCLCTGNAFRCNPNAPIATGKVADEFLQTLLAEVEKQNPKPKRKAPAATDIRNYSDNPAFDNFRARRMLDAIDPARLTFNEWLTVLTCCFNIGIDYATFDAWCRRDTTIKENGKPRYDASENYNHWTSRLNPEFGFGQLYTIAERFNFDAKATTKEWFELHPEMKQEKCTQDFIPDCPLDLRLPKNFLFSANGITYAEPPRKEDGKPRYHTVTLTPIIPTKKFRDPVKGIVEYEFALFNCGEWQTVEVDGATLADTRDLKKTFGKHGALIDEPAILTRYLNATIALNVDALPWIKSYKQTGWTSDDYDHFAYPGNTDSVIRREGYDYEKIFKPKGDADKWRDKFVEVMEQGGAPARVSFGVAAAALLVRPLKLHNLQAHVYGRRSIGKTPLLKFDVSAFGDPNLKALSYTFGTTSPKSRLELSAAFSDLPLVAEELESINKREAEHLPQDIYNYSLGIGGQVLNKDGTLREAKIFSGARLTDGEHDITNNNGNGGELKRVLPLRCATLLDEDFAADLHGFCKKHHGHFLKPWIQYIIEHRDEIERDYHQAKKTVEMRKGKKYDSTQVATLVSAAVAYQHFKICIGLQDNGDNEELGADLEAVLRSLPTADDIDDTKRAIDFLRDCCISRKKYFATESNKPKFQYEYTQTAWECYGKIFKNGEVAFPYSVLKKLLEVEGGFTSADKLINEFYDRDYLRHCNGLNTYPTKINGRTVRAIRFVSGVLLDELEDDEDDEDETTA